jgi:hypothetical protein
VYDFQSIAVSELRVVPLVAGHDVAIQLNGDAICLHAKRLNKPR